MSKKKIYLAHPISTRGEFQDSIRIANEIRKLGYEVYVASENNEINDKTNNPKASDIFTQDTDKILESDIFVVNITGGLQDGTITEIGFVGGYNYNMKKSERIEILAYTSSARLLDPQFYQGEMKNRIGIPSAGANHYTLGLIDFFGQFIGTEEDMLENLKKRKI